MSSSSDASQPRSSLGRLQASLASITLPSGIRNFVRSRSLGLVFVAIVIGVASGTLVVAIGTIVQMLHTTLFGLAPGQRLSAVQHLTPWRGVVVPVLGGGLLAGLTFLAKPLATRLADAIEANALYGGRMSVPGSLFVTAQTIVSSGFGGSVGLEAGYTQICTMLASRLGIALAARRGDMRLLVACGAAGAIAAAFNAPLAGAFYGFEVVLGTYTVGALAPVAASALVATLVARAWGDPAYLIAPNSLHTIGGADLLHIAGISIGAALIGIALMRAVGFSEAVFSGLLPKPLRPVAGGLAIGLLSLVTPQVLGAGHGALGSDLAASFPPLMLAMILVLKGAASAISLGSGFRGGLFYASLLLGALTGRLYVDCALWIDPGLALNPDLAALTGMAAFGTGVIGAPITMTALALETTGNFAITIAALIAAAIASVIVREMFGFSFATWRFHLRGEAIRGPHDIGWMRDLVVRKLMQSDVKTAPASLTVVEARRQFPLGTCKHFAVVDEAGQYLGMVNLDDLHTIELEGETNLRVVMRHDDALLFPWMSVREALDLFESAEADALIVVDQPASRRIVGVLSESYALRSYGRELERQSPDNVMSVEPLGRGGQTT